MSRQTSIDDFNNTDKQLIKKNTYCHKYISMLCDEFHLSDLYASKRGQAWGMSATKLNELIDDPAKKTMTDSDLLDLLFSCDLFYTMDYSKIMSNCIRFINIAMAHNGDPESFKKVALSTCIIGYTMQKNEEITDDQVTAIMSCFQSGLSEIRKNFQQIITMNEYNLMRVFFEAINLVTKSHAKIVYEQVIVPTGLYDFMNMGRGTLPYGQSSSDSLKGMFAARFNVINNLFDASKNNNLCKSFIASGGIRFVSGCMETSTGGCIDLFIVNIKLLANMLGSSLRIDVLNDHIKVPKVLARFMKLKYARYTKALIEDEIFTDMRIILDEVIVSSSPASMNARELVSHTAAVYFYIHYMTYAHRAMTCESSIRSLFCITMRNMGAVMKKKIAKIITQDVFNTHIARYLTSNNGEIKTCATQIQHYLENARNNADANFAPPRAPVNNDNDDDDDVEVVVEPPKKKGKLVTPPANDNNNNNNNNNNNTNWEERKTCVVCMENAKSVIFLPCAHIATCDTCTPSCKGQCPICRQKIKQVKKFFL